MEKKLKKLLADSDNELEKYVIEDLLDKEQEDKKYGAKGYINDLFQHGCVSGMVSSLIYYSDTKEFYNDFESEITEIVEDLEQQGCEPLSNKTYPLSNFLAWLGYEEMARKVAYKLGIEI